MSSSDRLRGDICFENVTMKVRKRSDGEQRNPEGKARSPGDRFAAFQMQNADLRLPFIALATRIF